MPSRIEIIESELLSCPVTAIVNPTNSSLLPNSEDEQKLHEAAGAKLAQECTHVAPCPVGEARITRGYNLPFDFVIHTVSPTWGGGEANEDKVFAHCYREIFKLVRSFEITSFAIPPLSSEAQGFPQKRAAHIAIKETLAELNKNKEIARLVLCCPDKTSVHSYEAAFDKINS